MRKLIMLSIALVACRSIVLGTGDECQSPSVQVPHDLARQIVRRMVREEPLEKPSPSTSFPHSLDLFSFREWRML
jgi:hypothetical protein